MLRTNFNFYKKGILEEKYKIWSGLHVKKSSGCTKPISTKIKYAEQILVYISFWNLIEIQWIWSDGQAQSPYYFFNLYMFRK